MSISLPSQHVIGFMRRNQSVLIGFVKQKQQPNNGSGSSFQQTLVGQECVVSPKNVCMECYPLPTVLAHLPVNKQKYT